MRVGLASVEVNSLRTRPPGTAAPLLAFYGTLWVFFILLLECKYNFFLKVTPLLFFYLLSVRSVDLKKTKTKTKFLFH